MGISKQIIGPIISYLSLMALLLRARLRSPPPAPTRRRQGSGKARPTAFDTPHPDAATTARIDEALAFDDVPLVPGYSQVLPSATDTRTCLTRTIPLNIPIISAAMNTATESATIHQDGLGVIYIEPRCHLHRASVLPALRG